MRTFVFFLLVLSLSSCSPQYKKWFYENQAAEREIKWVKDFCDQYPMVGTESGFKLFIDAKRKELESAEGTLNASRYRKLSTDLINYTAKAELLNSRFSEACRFRALCMYREKSNLECSNSEERYQDSLDSLFSLLEKLEQFSPE